MLLVETTVHSRQGGKHHPSGGYNPPGKDEKRNEGAASVTC